MPNQQELITHKVKSSAPGLLITPITHIPKTEHEPNRPGIKEIIAMCPLSHKQTKLSVVFEISKYTLTLLGSRLWSWPQTSLFYLI